MTDRLQHLIADLRARLRTEIVGLALRHRRLEAGEARRLERAVDAWLAPLEDEARALAAAAAAGARAAAAFDAAHDTADIDTSNTEPEPATEERDDEDPTPEDPAPL